MIIYEEKLHASVPLNLAALALTGTELFNKMCEKV